MVGIITLMDANNIPHYYSFLIESYRYWEGRGETSQFIPSSPSYLKKRKESYTKHKANKGFIYYQ